jgi:hypothetical protein
MRKKEGKDDVHVLRKKSEGKSVVKAGVYISTP